MKQSKTVQQMQETALRCLWQTRQCLPVCFHKMESLLGNLAWQTGNWRIWSVLARNLNSVAFKATTRLQGWLKEPHSSFCCFWYFGGRNPRSLCKASGSTLNSSKWLSRENCRFQNSRLPMTMQVMPASKSRKPHRHPRMPRKFYTGLRSRGFPTYFWSSVSLDLDYAIHYSRWVRLSPLPTKV